MEQALGKVAISCGAGGKMAVSFSQRRLSKGHIAEEVDIEKRFSAFYERVVSTWIPGATLESLTPDGTSIESCTAQV